MVGKAKDGESKMPFGKYQGKTLNWLYQNDPAYLLWAGQTMFGTDIQEEIRIFLKEKNRQIISRGPKD